MGVEQHQHLLKAGLDLRRGPRELEPTNQTRPTMRVRTWLANLPSSASLACGARIRAIRPAEQI
jgi:hypothetical protein